MKQRTVILLVLCAFLGAHLIAQVPAGAVSLFNGKDLKNWKFCLKDPAVDPATVFTVKDGVIHISGDPFGYMTHK